MLEIHCAKYLIYSNSFKSSETHYETSYYSIPSYICGDGGHSATMRLNTDLNLDYVDLTPTSNCELQIRVVD